MMAEEYLASRYAAAEAFDASMTPQHRAAFARLARSAWLESGGSEETWRSNFPSAAADIDADKSEQE